MCLITIPCQGKKKPRYSQISENLSNQCHQCSIIPGGGMEYLHQELAERIIKCFYEVYNTLGHGFLEKVYEQAMMIELSKNGLTARRHLPVKVYYDGEAVGEYFADIMVENSVVLELKAAAALLEEHECQLINYLKATDIEIGLLLNFGKKPEMRRKIFTNDRKKTEHR